MEYDKDKAREKFFKDNPGFGQSTRHEPFEITKEELELIVELYPLGKNRAIAEMLGISDTKFAHVVTVMRASGIKLEKQEAEDPIKKALEALKQSRPELFIPKAL